MSNSPSRKANEIGVFQNPQTPSKPLLSIPKTRGSTSPFRDAQHASVQPKARRLNPLQTRQKPQLPAPSQFSDLQQSMISPEFSSVANHAPNCLNSVLPDTRMEQSVNLSANLTTKTDTRTESSPLTSQILHFMADPQILVNFETAPGELPRSIALERKRRQLAEIDFQKLIDFEIEPGMESYDDEKFETKSLMEWWKFAKKVVIYDANKGQEREVNGLYGQCYFNGVWEKCVVIGQKEGKMLLFLKDQNSAQKYFIYRLFVFIWGEDPEIYVQRLRNALFMKKQQESSLKYFACIENMPVNGLVKFNLEDQIVEQSQLSFREKFILTFTQDNYQPVIDQVESKIPKLIEEIKNNYAISQNRILFEISLQKQPSLIPELQLEKAVDLLQMQHKMLFNNVEKTVFPYFYMIGISSENFGNSYEEITYNVKNYLSKKFTETKSKISFESFLTHPEAIKALFIAKNEAEKLVSYQFNNAQKQQKSIAQEYFNVEELPFDYINYTTSLYQILQKSDSPTIAVLQKTYSAEEFKTLQSNHQKQLKSFLEDQWIPHLKNQLLDTLKHSGKGHFNVQVKSKQVYLQSKLRKLVLRIIYLLNDSLRYLVENSVNQYVEFFKVNSEWKVKCIDSQNVISEHADNSQNAENIETALTVYRYPVFSINVTVDDKPVSTDEKAILDRLEGGYIYGISPLTEERDIESEESEAEQPEADSDADEGKAEKKEQVQEKQVQRPKQPVQAKKEEIVQVQMIKNLAFSSQLDDFLQAIGMTFDNGLKAVSAIPDIEPMLLIQIVQSEKTYICPPEPTEEIFKVAKSQIAQYVTKMYNFLPDYLKQFNKYKELILIDNDKLVATIKYRAEMYLQSQKEDVKQEQEEELPDVSQVMLQAIEEATPLDPDGLRDLVHQKLAQAKQIQIEIPEAVHVGAYLVKNAALRNFLSQKLTTQAEMIQQIIIEIAQKKAVMIGTVFNNLNRKLNHKSKNIEEVIKLEEFLKHKIDSVLTLMKGNIAIMNQYYQILDELLLQQPPQVVAQRFKTASYPRDINNLYKQVLSVIDSDKIKFKDQQQLEQSNLVKDIDTSTRTAQNFPHKFVKVEDYKSANEEAERLGRQMQRMHEKSKVINKREMLLGQSVTDYSALESTIKEFEPIQTIWRCMAEFKSLSQSIMAEDFRFINAQKTEQLIEGALKNVQKSIRSIKDENELVKNIGEQIKQEILEFKKHLPLLCALRNPGLRKRHWLKISKETNCNLSHLRYINGIELRQFSSKPTPDEQSDTDYNDMTPEQIEDLNKQPVNFTFKQALEEYELQKPEKLHKIIQISEIATKEFQIETILTTLEQTWKSINFTLMQYQNSDCFILKALDDIIQSLDDNITIIQQISFSPFKKYFAELISSWEFKLQLTSEIIEVWITLQQAWLYLEPIFSSPDISRQLPNESKIFKHTDGFWRKFMSNVQKLLNVIKICTETEKLLPKLKEHNKQLETVQKGLADYLETKRIAFPRFYFLSDEELLSILSNTKNPTSVQPFLRSCFENVGRLKFIEENNFQIVSMSSHEGEIVQFVDPLTPSGNVENWMGQLEKQVLKTVKIRTVEMLVKYIRDVTENGVDGRAEWVKSGFAQGINIVNQICFANDTDWAISGGYLQKYYDQLEKQLGIMTNLVRTGLNKQESKCFSSVLTYDVFQRDQIQVLIDAKVSQISDFNWAKHPKHFCNVDEFYEQSMHGINDNYMENPSFNKENYKQKVGQICEAALALDTNFTITFNQVVSSLPYQFEYLGNTPRLVITPLTLKIYSTIAQSQTLYKFSSASGPAGSGKTETSKQTTNKEFGLVCVVFNCSEGLDLIGIKRMLSGVISTGGCLIMDEINRLSLDVLSVFAQMVLSVQRGLQLCGGSIVKPPVHEFGKSAAHIQNVKLNFEGVELTLQSTAIVIITQNPNYSGRQKLPANLVALFRSVSVMVPNYMKICQIRLYSFGFNKATALAQKATSVFKLCSEQLSLQSWYDYGMRAINSTIQAAGNIRQELGSYCVQNEGVIPVDEKTGTADNRYYTEEQIVLRAITEVNLPKFLASDAFLFSNILKDLFPGVSQPYIDYQKLISELQIVLRSKQHQFLQPEPTFISKIVDLYMTINLRHGLMTLGPACSGKTESLYVLETTLNRLNKQQLDEKMNKFNKMLKQNPELPVSEITISEDFQFEKYNITRINPKSITMDQLFGQFDAISKEWQDGVLSTQIRNAVADYNKHQFWIENQLFNEFATPSANPTISDLNPLVYLQKSNFTRQICLSCGYIDSLWIESLNTVLDDSKRLCLNSGEIIALSPVMNLIFNMDSVAEASPATISRCGMLYYESLTITQVGDQIVSTGTLKLENFIQTYIDRLPDQVRLNTVDLSKIGEISKTFETKFGITEDYSTTCKLIQKLCEMYLSQTIAFMKLSCMMQQEITDANLVLSLFKLLNTFIFEMKINDFGYYENYQLLMLNSYIEKFFFFSLVWSVGAVIGDEKSREIFDKFLRELILKNGHLVDLPLPNEGTVFDYQFMYVQFSDLKEPVAAAINDGKTDEEALEGKIVQSWQPWQVEQLKSLTSTKDGYNLLETIIQTPNNISQSYLIQKLLSNDNNILIVGPTGSGKTQIIKNYLLTSPDTSYQIPVTTTFSANTQANDLMNFVDQKLEKRRRGVFGPPAGKKYALYIDDLNMPNKEKYGCINSHELIRQLIDHGGWYDLKEITFKTIIDTNVICSMCPVGGARNPVNMRLVRHFNIVNFLELNNTQLSNIFDQILNIWVTKTFDADVIGQDKFDFLKSSVLSLIDVELDIYNETKNFLLPTPSKMHYTFNLRDFAKVFQGMLMIDPQFVYLNGQQSKEQNQVIINDQTIIKQNIVDLFVHENLRVFYDRLIDTTDQSWYLETLNKAVQNKLNTTINSPETMLFSDFIPNFSIKNYQKQTDLPQIKQKLEQTLLDFNDYTQNNNNNLVLFNSAISHLSRITRILSQPNSNLLLIGIGGVGRQSLTKLSAYILKLELTQIELKKGYQMSDWKLDIKNILINSGLNNKNTVFLLSDSHIFDEKQLEDVSLMLNSCDFQSLYEPAEIEQIYNQMKPICMERQLQPTKINLYDIYLQNVKQNLKVVLCFSPSGNSLRTRLRAFPALVACTSINFMFNWPERALFDVGNDKLGFNGLSGEEGPQIQFLNQFIASQAGTLTIDQIRTQILNFTVHCHNSIEQFSLQFYQIHHKHNKITPTLYLNLLIFFTKFLQKQQLSLENTRNQLKTGLQKLLETQEIVATMQTELIALQPLLVQSSEKVEISSLEIQKSTASAKELQEVASTEQQFAAQKLNECQTIESDAMRDLAQAQPLLDAAMTVLNSLEKKDFSELGSYANPAIAIRQCMESVCILFNIKGKRLQDPNTPGKFIEDFWDESKKLLNNSSLLLTNLKTFDKENISQATINKLEFYIKLEDFNPVSMKQKSGAASGLCAFVIAMYKFYFINLEVIPKRKALEKARSELAEVEENLKISNEKVEKINGELAILQEKFDGLIAEKQQINDNVEVTSVKLERAERLISSLSGEQVRWTEQLANVENDVKCVLGDCLLASCCQIYIGAFSSDFREKILLEWKGELDKLNIQYSNKKITEIFSDQISILQYVNEFKLPSDGNSTENACYLFNSIKSVMLIDPENQAVNFLKNYYKEAGFDICKMSDPNMLKKLENCIRFGKVLILTHCTEEIDPSLAPLLEQNFTIENNIQYIKLNDNAIPFSSQFKLFLATNLQNPNFSPENFVKMTVLNFSLTQQGLQAQLLGDLISLERPDQEALKSSLLLSNSQMKTQLKSLEIQVLTLLSTSEGDILSNLTLIDTLQLSQKTSVEISQKIAESIKTEAEIDETRQKYIKMAERGAILYFCVQDLQKVEFMYQYSLNWYINVYKFSIVNSEQSEDIQQRITNLIDFFTYHLYQTVCRSLFESHKMLFAVLLALRIQFEAGEITLPEMKYFLTFEDFNAEIQCPVSWMPKNCFNQLCKLETVHPNFADIAHFTGENAELWRVFFTSNSPELEVLPSPYQEILTPFQRFLPLLALRPDRISKNLRHFISTSLSAPFAEPQIFDLEKSFSECKNVVPIVFLLNDLADPINDLMQFAESMRMSRKLQVLSLGRGIEQTAINLIRDFAERGNWAILQNCHLSVKFLQKLGVEIENLIENFQSVHKDFRLFLTSQPCDEFPVAILQNSVKVSVENPNNLKSNLLRVWQSAVTDNLLNSVLPENVLKHKKLIFSLSIFYSVLLQRKKYGPLGFNTPYAWSVSDVQICIQSIGGFIDRYEDFYPKEALLYLFGEINIGGCVTDSTDQRVVNALGLDYLDESVVADGFSWQGLVGENGMQGGNSTTTVKTDEIISQLVGNMDYRAIIDHIQQVIPNDVNPLNLGLNLNSNITAEHNESKSFLHEMLNLQNGVISNVGSSSESVGEREKICHIQTQIPKLFDLAAIQLKYPTLYEESLNSLLVQECGRYNTLIETITVSLENLLKALSGLTILNFELENVLKSLVNNQIPELFDRFSFPSLKPFSSYLVDLNQRIRFFDNWIQYGKPSVYHLPSFFFASGFLTSLLQNYARKTSIAIDSIGFNFDVKEEILDDKAMIYEGKTYPLQELEDGIYISGLYLEGARFDKTITEAVQRELYFKMPVMVFTPSCEVGIGKDQYECPCYRTLARFGLLSTTGHSTNFLLFIGVPCQEGSQKHWIKRSVALFGNLSD